MTVISAINTKKECHSSQPATEIQFEYTKNVIRIYSSKHIVNSQSATDISFKYVKCTLNSILKYTKVVNRLMRLTRVHAVMRKLS